MQAPRRLTVIMHFVIFLALLLLGCSEETVAPSLLKTQVKINISALGGPVDHGWLTIDNTSKSRHRMTVVGDFLQSEIVNLSPGNYNFEVEAVDVDENVLFRGERTVTISSEVEFSPIEMVLVSLEPDLVVSSLTHSPTSPTITDLITFTAVVRNDGGGSSGPSMLEFRVGGESSPPTFSVPALASGETHEVQRQETLGVAQNYQVTATADIEEAVTESNEQNNETIDTFTVTTALEIEGGQ